MDWIFLANLNNAFWMNFCGAIFCLIFLYAILCVAIADKSDWEERWGKIFLRYFTKLCCIAIFINIIITLGSVPKIIIKTSKDKTKILKAEVERAQQLSGGKERAGG